MTISDQLRKAIAETGMTQAALAKSSGISQSMLARFINGKGVHVETADKLAAYFNLELTPAAAKSAKKPTKRKK